MNPKALFSEGDVFSLINQQSSRVQEVVDTIPKDQFLNASDDALVEHVTSKLAISAIELKTDQLVAQTREDGVRVSSYYSDPYENSTRRVTGTVVTIELPFSGDPVLFKLQPSTFTTMYPRASVVSKGESCGHLEFQFEQAPGVAPEQLKQRMDAEIRMVSEYVGWQQGQINAFNSQLPLDARRAVELRRTRLLEQDRLVAVLGIPLKHAPGANSILPMRRKIVRPLPTAPRAGYSPEPGIADDDYEHILRVIRHEGRTFETTPRTYQKLEEEELRDILLAHLNGHYEGDASGETFRKLGKTDIRIEDKNRCAFVGECKVWSGEKKLLEGLEQLLGYLTWRDCKAALVVFNKSVSGFSDLLQKLPKALQAHELSRRAPTPKEGGEWRCRYASKSDPSREVIVHIFIFNLYVGAA